jgi:hypothetical protein
MTDILEQRTDVFLLSLLLQQMILNPRHRSILAVIDEMVPRACITIQHSLCFDKLSAVLAALALKRVVRIAARFGVVEEKLSQAVGGEVAFDVFGAVDDAT